MAGEKASLRAGEARPTPGGAWLEVALSPDHRLLPGGIANAPTVFGFENISRLGGGSSGEVWLAEELETGRMVALKILHRGRDSAQEELQREFRILAELIHPNLVVLFHGVVTADGRHGFAMEWIDGLPLDEWLELHSELSLEKKLELFRGIVQGVAFLHNHGVIHRDLKPANVIVAANGLPKIVDFGLARLHQQGADPGNDGGSTGVAGTLHFMAPEQAANGPGSRAMPVDVFALGLILHRILTGCWLRPPGGTPAEILVAVLNPPLLLLRGRSRRLPRDIQAILRQSLAPDPAHRYHHAGELAADLDRFSAKQPVAARKHTFRYLGATLLRRQARRSVVAGVLVLAGLVAGGMIYHRHRLVAERNDANLRYAYTLTSFALGKLRDELRATSAVREGGPGPRTTLPGAAAMPPLPVDADGELDLRYYHALLADLRSATSEGHAHYAAAMKSIQPALDLYSDLALESPEDPWRLLDAAQARLGFARLLDRTGRTDSAGGEARKVLRQLDRLAAWPEFDRSPLPPLRCDALRLIAREAHHGGDPERAFLLGLDTFAACAALPPGLLVRPENESVPRLALAAADLASYAIAAGPSTFPRARLEITRAAEACRGAHARAPESTALSRGLSSCLHALARISLKEKRGEDLRPLFGEMAELLIRSQSVATSSSIPLVTEISVSATDWAGEILDQPDLEIAESALSLATAFTVHVRRHGAASDDIVIQRGRLFLYRSQLLCRQQDRRTGVRSVNRALALLLSLQARDPGRNSLALLTVKALHHSRSLADLPESGWNQQRAARLERLLAQLGEKVHELSPEQRRQLDLFR